MIKPRQQAPRALIDHPELLGRLAEPFARVEDVLKESDVSRRSCAADNAA